MKLCFGILVAALVLSAPMAGAQNYTATLDGLQEVPANASPATGSAVLSLDGAKMLHFSIAYGGLLGTETAAHFHGPANPGANAGVQIGLPAGQPKNGSVGPLTAIQEADLNAGLWYINIHTTVFGGGEIRGQVIQEAVPVENTTWGRIKTLLK